GGGEGAGGVDARGGGPLLGRGGGKGRTLADAGVVDEHVAAAEPAEERLDLCLVRHVADRATDGNDLVAERTEPLDDRLADPARPAGDHHEPAHVTTTFLYSSTRADCPGATTSVVIGVQTIAGPAIRFPGESRSKSYPGS